MLFERQDPHIGFKLEAYKLLAIVGCIPHPGQLLFLCLDHFSCTVRIPLFFHGPEHCTVVLLPLETWAAYLSHICPSIKKLSRLFSGPQWLVTVLSRRPNRLLPLCIH